MKIRLKIDNKPVALDFGGEQAINIKGNNKMNIILAFEVLCGADMIHNIVTKDAVYGVNYSNIEDCMIIFNNNSVLATKGGKVVRKGDLPNIHCIRYTNDGEIRSCMLSDTSNISTDLTKYSNILTETMWYRLMTTVNKLLGYPVVHYNDKQLSFEFKDNSEYSIKAQKFIYLLVAECFLTPPNFIRIVLLNDVELLSTEQQLKLVTTLNELKGGCYCISTLDDIDGLTV